MGKLQMMMIQLGLDSGRKGIYMVFVSSFTLLLILIFEGVEAKISGSVSVYEYKEGKLFGRCTCYNE